MTRSPLFRVARLLLALLPVLILIVSPVRASEGVPETTSERALAFLDAVVSGKPRRVFEDFDGPEMLGRSAHVPYAMDLTDYAQFLALYERVFNEPLVEALRDAEPVEVTPMPPSWRDNYAWESASGIGDRGRIIIWFHTDGSPDWVSNPYSTVTSFDCSKAQTPTEHTICNDPALAKLDGALRRQYRRAQRFLTDEDLLELRQQQRAFLSRRDACEADDGCIATLVRERVSTLEGLVSAEAKKPAPAIGEGVLDMIEGHWHTGKYINAANCTKHSYEERAERSRFLIDVAYPEVIVTPIIDGERREPVQCRIAKQAIHRFRAIYEAEGYRTRFGTCGGDIGRLPYRGIYAAFAMERTDGEAWLANLFGGCGSLVLSTNALGHRALLFGGGLTDELVTHGYPLQPAERVRGNNARVTNTE